MAEPVTWLARLAEDEKELRVDEGRILQLKREFDTEAIGQNIRPRIDAILTSILRFSIVIDKLLMEMECAHVKYYSEYYGKEYHARTRMINYADMRELLIKLIALARRYIDLAHRFDEYEKHAAPIIHGAIKQSFGAERTTLEKILQVLVIVKNHIHRELVQEGMAMSIEGYERELAKLNRIPKRTLRSSGLPQRFLGQ